MVDLLVVEHHECLRVGREAYEIGALLFVGGVGEDLQREGTLGLIVDLHNRTDYRSGRRMPQLVPDANGESFGDAVELLSWGLDDVGAAVVGAPQDSRVRTFSSQVCG